MPNSVGKLMPPTYNEATGDFVSPSPSRGISPDTRRSSMQTSPSSERPAFPCVLAAELSLSPDCAWLLTRVSNRLAVEDERRPLPPGWVRSFDAEHKHQFFVDTRSSPARSIWHHPMDDEAYLASLTPKERTRARMADQRRRWSKGAEITSDSDSDDDENYDEHRLQRPSIPSLPPQLPPPQQTQGQRQRGSNSSTGSGSGSGSGSTSSAPHAPSPPPSGPMRLGRHIKDAVTGTTHLERSTQRSRHAAEEAALATQHRLYRAGLQAAMTTGTPQLLGVDDADREVYLEPPGTTFAGVREVRRLSPGAVEVVYASPAAAPVKEAEQGARYVRSDFAGARFGFPGGGGGGGGNGDGDVDAGGTRVRFGRPYGPYGRPRERGYGGGGAMGLPMMAPLFGGMMLGGMLF
ncbi:hypothetical protein F5B20DRAFT_594168 [Whalleya microplaca]|nr:hypothetical protein F5B20DRAFT_594168 [Whalleya microplaca]